MQAGVITFPGSNCDRDIEIALAAAGAKVARLWHGATELPKLDLIVLPGGFTYGDYLRCGAIAAHAPVMAEVIRRAAAGVAVLGICNGFQILTEAGLLPGALIRNRGLKFICRPVTLEVATSDSAFTAGYAAGQTVEIPIAHHDGWYVCGPDDLERLADEDRIAFRYLDNPNGSIGNVAGVLGAGRNVLGMMPHPERAADPRNGRHRRPDHAPHAGRGPSMTSDATFADAAEHGLSEAEYARIVEILGRAPNLVELGIFSVMWSEHCSYKSSQALAEAAADRGPAGDLRPGRERGRGRHRRRHGRGVQDREPQPPELHRALPGGGDRGRRHPARRLHDGRTAGGATSIRCASARRTIRGPATWSRAWSPASAATATASACRRSAARRPSTAAYDGNILVNAMCVGLARKDQIFYARAAGAGNPVVYVGAKTGRDGIHGATMASAEFSEATEARRPTVQVGDPFTEKLLLEACLELMQTDAIVAIQDMGAAGLTSSSFEMAARGGTGIEMDLDRVPTRETGMTPYEILLSESQERMLLVLRRGAEAEARGSVRQMGSRLRPGRPGDRQRRHGDPVRRRGGRARADRAGQRRLADLRAAVGANPGAAADRSLATSTRRSVTGRRCCGWSRSPDLASKRWICEQYDHMVMGDTVLRPGGDAAVVRIHGSNRGARADHRLYAALLPGRPRNGRPPGGRRGLAQSLRGRRAPARAHRLPELRQPREPGGHGPVRRLPRRHGGGLPGARLPGRVGQRRRSTTRPTARRSCRRR